VIRVGLDGRAFHSPAGGIRRYVNGLVRGLLALGEPIELVALGGTADGLPPGVAHIAEPTHPPSNAGWTLVGLPRAARRGRVDLIHAPAYTAPFWSPVPVVLTIHDVSYARHPEWYPYRRDWLRRAFYRRSAYSASIVLTVSTFSATEIMEAYGIPEARIAVVPLGVDGAFVPARASDLPPLPAGVSEPFLLHVGDLHERRNLPVVVEALVAARQQFGALAALSLVLAGVDRGVGDALSEMADHAGMSDAVVCLGVVSEERLRDLYHRGIALVYPSLYEGFGLPLLEAMASGTPVIASHAASIPEVVGAGGILLDPLDVRGWTEAMVEIVNDHHRRADLRAAGLRRAAQFTWERTARLTLDAYKRVA
jgi:glycosyltransferase involved in cell wall biosynthesis